MTDTKLRGARASRGRTSWTAKPELWDFISFIGFFIHYVDGLTPPWVQHTMQPSLSPAVIPLSRIQSELPAFSNTFDHVDQGMTLILGGYSYGALVASSLPSTETILSHFSYVHKGTAVAEIMLRALHLSTQWNNEAKQRPQRGRSVAAESPSPRSPSSVKVGGEECEPGTRRVSRDSRSSLDIVRRSIDRSRPKIALKRHTTDPEALPMEGRCNGKRLAPPRTLYLLISPLLPPISMFATMFSKPNTYLRWPGQGPPHVSDTMALPTNDKFRICPTLAIYGDKDFFTSHKKLRKWAEQMTSGINSHFTWEEINGAGHFWHEVGVDAKMRECLRDWIVDMVGDPASPHRPRA